MTLLPVRRPDGSPGDLQMDEYGRLKVEKAETGELAEGALLDLRQNDDGELLTAEGGSS